MSTDMAQEVRIELPEYLTDGYSCLISISAGYSFGKGKSPMDKHIHCVASVSEIDLYDMKLFDEYRYGADMEHSIQRVPGGWNFIYPNCGIYIQFSFEFAGAFGKANE